jgi:vitamin B12 transporter
LQRPLSACCALAALYALSTLPAGADAAPAPSPSPSALPEIGRVSTSDRRSEPIDRSSRPTYVIDRAQLDALGARTVADALQTLPGVTIYRYGAFGAQTDYGLLGANSEQTLVLLDGVPISAGTTGSVDLGSFPLGGVQRIEVVESGASTLYGTSAVGGVVNIITGVPRGPDVALSDGSYGDRDARVSLGDGHVGFSYERHVAGNDYPYPALNYAEAQFPAGVRYNDWADQSDGRLTFTQSLGSRYAVRAGLGLNAIDVGVPGGLDYLTPEAVQRTTRSDAELELSRSGGASTLSLTVSGSRQALVYADPQEGGESDTYDGRAQISVKDVIAGDRSAFVAGIDLSRESALLSLGPDGPPPTFGASQSQSAAYLQDQIEVGSSAQATFGLRGENDAPRGSVLAPTFGGLLHLGVLRLAGNVGESFRVPTLDDLYYPGYSNPKLVPEKAQNEDVTLSWPSLGGGVSLGWFGRGGSNFIVLNDAYIPENIQRAAIDGFIARAATRPLYGMVTDLSVTDVYRALDLTTLNRLPRNPVMQASLGLTRPFGTGRFAFGARARIVGSDGDDAFGVGPYSYDAFTTVDAYVRYKLAKSAIVSLRAKNLGDERYAAVAGYPAPGRALFLELSTR